MKKNICLGIVSILCIVFIFYNSSQNGKLSNIRSNKVADKIVNIIMEENIDKDIYSQINEKELNNIVRKCAHGFEYCLFSIAISVTLKSLKLKWNTVITNTLLIILLCGVLDEFYQLYISGRGSSVVDVLIDFMGGTLGVLLFCFIYILVMKIINSVLKTNNTKRL